MKIGDQILNIKLRDGQRYRLKDVEKFKHCNKLISRGVKGSSSAIYAAHCENVNCGHYESTDVVGVSVNGMRSGRLKFDKLELSKAGKVGATIVTDNQNDRYRSYNIGEREVAEYLYLRGYREANSNGIWNYEELG